MAEINTEEVFKKIKKQNGERVAKQIREAALLGIPDIVHILEFAGSDVNDIRNIIPIIKETHQERPETIIHTNKEPIQLLNEAGYDAFSVQTQEQKDSIKKYFRPHEELCTFRDPHRHENFYIIHAVKRNAEEIKPLKNPTRQDEYGTSVISIQISKKGGFISIKNRYNHTVNDPDNTFNNNPDNIIPGLSESLKKYFNVDFSVTDSIMPENFRIVNNQLVRYNYETDDFYFGNNYYFNGNQITKLNSDYQYMLDCFVFDTKTSELTNPSNTKDASFEILQKLLVGKKIKIQPSPIDKNEKMFFADGEHVLTISNGQIVELNMPDIEHIGDNFLHNNIKLRKLIAPKIKKVGNNFLPKNQHLTNLSFPELITIGNGFLMQNGGSLTEIYLPQLQKAGAGFLSENHGLKSLSLPNIKTLGSGALTRLNTSDLYFPNLEEVSDGFLALNTSKKISLPALKSVGNNFLCHNDKITELEVPLLESTGNEFLSNGTSLMTLSLPKIKTVGDRFLQYNTKLMKIYAPNLETVGVGFLGTNTTMKELNLPALKTIKFGFFNMNNSLQTLILPELKDIMSDTFLPNNSVLMNFSAPKLKQKNLWFQLTLKSAKHKLQQLLKKTDKKSMLLDATGNDRVSK